MESIVYLNSVPSGSYSKSLKLLGLDIPSNRREATKLENTDVEVRTSSPTMRTRLVKRTTSYSDLRTKVYMHKIMPTNILHTCISIRLI